MIQKGQKLPKTKFWDLNSILPQFSANFVDFGIRMFVKNPCNNKHIEMTNLLYGLSAQWGVNRTFGQKLTLSVLL